MSSLKRLRKGAGLTQQELSFHNEIPLSAIRKYESGEKPLNKASAENIYRIDAVLEVEMVELLDIEKIYLSERIL